MNTFLLFIFPCIVYVASGIGYSVYCIPEKYKHSASARFMVVFGWPIVFLLTLVTILYLYIAKGNVENW